MEAVGIEPAARWKQNPKRVLKQGEQAQNTAPAQQAIKHKLMRPRLRFPG